MSRYLSDAAAQQFDADVAHDFQAMGYTLMGSCRERRGVIGDTYNFRRMGTGQATQRSAPSVDVTPMDVSHDLIPCALSAWEASEYTDIFSQTDVNFSERRELSQTIAGALGRRVDQLIIDAIESTSNVPGQSKAFLNDGADITADIGGNNSNLNITKIRQAASLMDAANVPAMDRYWLAHSNQKQGILGEDKATSSDYMNLKALVQGDINTFYGFKFIWIGDRDEGGLSMADADDRYNYAFHKRALGAAIALSVSTSVDWVPQKKSWLSSGETKLGAVKTDANGVVRILCDDNATYNGA